MKILSAIAATIWTFACFAIYLAVPAVMHWEGDSASAWYAMGWVLLLGIWAVPVLMLA